MTEEQQRGRKLATAVAVAVVVPQILTFLVLAAAGVPLGNLGLWFNLLVGVVLAVGLVRGAWWAQAYGTWVLVLGTLGSIFTALTGGVPGLVVGLPLAAIYGFCAWLLWTSPSIEAFFQGRRAKQDESLRLERL